MPVPHFTFLRLIAIFIFFIKNKKTYTRIWLINILFFFHEARQVRVRQSRSGIRQATFLATSSCPWVQDIHEPTNFSIIFFFDYLGQGTFIPTEQAASHTLGYTAPVWAQCTRVQIYFSKKLTNLICYLRGTSINLFNYSS